MSVISRLLSRLGVASDAPEEDLGLPALELQAVRRRMTPTETGGADVRRRAQSYVLPLRTSGASLAELPWQSYGADAEWKPVVLSDVEMSLPVVPSLDELAEEGGIKPTEPRFPLDA